MPSWLLVFGLSTSWGQPGRASSDSCAGIGPLSDSCSTSAVQQSTTDEDRWLQTDQTSLLHLNSKVARRGSVSAASKAGAEHGKVREVLSKAAPAVPVATEHIVDVSERRGTTADTTVEVSPLLADAAMPSPRLRLSLSSIQSSTWLSRMKTKSHILAWVLLLGIFLVSMAFCLVMQIAQSDDQASKRQSYNTYKKGAYSEYGGEAHAIPGEDSAALAHRTDRSVGLSSMQGIPERQNLRGVQYSAGLDPVRPEGIAAAEKQMRLSMAFLGGRANNLRYTEKDRTTTPFPVHVGGPTGPTDFKLMFAKGAVEFDPTGPDEYATLRWKDPESNQFVVVGSAAYKFTNKTASILRYQSEEDEIKGIEPERYCDVIHVSGSPGDPQCVYTIVSSREGQKVLAMVVNNVPNGMREVSILHVEGEPREAARQKGAFPDGLVCHAKRVPRAAANTSREISISTPDAHEELVVYPTGDIFLSILLITIADRLEVDHLDGSGGIRMSNFSM